jgi:hypothetical protein
MCLYGGERERERERSTATLKEYSSRTKCKYGFQRVKQINLPTKFPPGKCIPPMVKLIIKHEINIQFWIIYGSLNNYFFLTP